MVTSSVSSSATRTSTEAGFPGRVVVSVVKVVLHPIPLHARIDAKVANMLLPLNDSTCSSPTTAFIFGRQHANEYISFVFCQDSAFSKLYDL